MKKSSRRRRRITAIQARVNPDAFTQDQGTATRPCFGFLDDGAIEQLKRRAFDLLATHGVIVIHPLAAEALQKAGAMPGSDADRLRLPRRLVEEALEATPRRVSLQCADGVTH